MKIDSLRIKNYRTIGSEQTVEFQNGLTIVGPNSSGKTNILKAIEMIFTGFDNKSGYETKKDKTFGIANEQTTLTVGFSGERSGIDKDFFDLYDELNRMLESPKVESDSFLLYLSFPSSGNPKYVFFSNDKKKKGDEASFSRTQRSAVNLLLEKFVCHYVPSSKSIDDLYFTLLHPFIKRSVSGVLKDKLNKINSVLGDISKSLDDQLNMAGLSHVKSHFSLPHGSIEFLIDKFEFHLSDPSKTTIDRKGMGIQASAILASFLWITQEEKKINKTPIWLIEEPESYLHPELAESCHKMLDKINSEAMLVVTTHSLGFVSKDPQRIIGTTSDENNHTKIIKYKSYSEATSSIRKALGVRFSDFYNLGVYNIFVEGKTDREIFKWFLDVVTKEEDIRYNWPIVRKSEILDFTGVSSLESFLKATFEYMYKERPVFVVFDGDEAAEKRRRSLQSYFSNKHIPFESKKDFASLHRGFSLEGLFPHSWIIEAHDLHPNWFETYDDDIAGQLMTFSLKNETNKEQLRGFLKNKTVGVELTSWVDRFVELFDVVEKALNEKHHVIYG